MDAACMISRDVESVFARMLCDQRRCKWAICAHVVREPGINWNAPGAPGPSRHSCSGMCEGWLVGH